jgi:methyl coenzyme M reductase subunit C-like uncharacterized protein (methanogenesis marker protein 7)
MKQKKITKAENAKLLILYCVLPTIADYLEDIPFEGEIKEAVDNLITLSRDMDDRIFSQVSEEEKRVIADQQWKIQVSFRDWVISNFDLAQKDIKKIPPVQP